MQTQFCEFNVKGKTVKVPAHTIGQRLVVLTGKWFKIARLHEEEWMENVPFENIDSFLHTLRKTAPRADIFTFAQDFAQAPTPFPYPCEEEDVAAVRVTTFAEWWEGLPQESRKNVRKAEKRGVTAAVAVFDDAFISGIKAIYDETPIRQGRRFWHYGKDIETIRRENATFLDRSDFIAAYHQNELIGFIKLVYVGKCARIMQILSMNAHLDKKTPNILLSKAVEVCAQKGMSHLVYARYYYGNKGHTPITEFKRRNGFQRIVFHRYFIPLTLKGRIAVAMKLHLGLSSLLPPGLTRFLLDARARLLLRRQPKPAVAIEPPISIESKS